MLEYVLQHSSDTDMSAKVVASSCLGFWAPAASHFSHLPLLSSTPKVGSAPKNTLYRDLLLKNSTKLVVWIPESLVML